MNLQQEFVGIKNHTNRDNTLTHLSITQKKIEPLSHKHFPVKIFKMSVLEILLVIELSYLAYKLIVD